MEKIITIQFIVLLIGTLFAWTNFSIELFAWMKNEKCPMGCNGGKIVNPFLTPCFYGAIFFTISFILSIILLIN